MKQKRFMSLLLTLCMILSMVTTSVFADTTDGITVDVSSAYIEGIANLYEFDCGEISGWMYKVNGWFPNYGCSRYALKQGDRVEWVYTCDLGNDVGGGAWQKDE